MLKFRNSRLIRLFLYSRAPYKDIITYFLWNGVFFIKKLSVWRNFFAKRPIIYLFLRDSPFMNAYSTQTTPSSLTVIFMPSLTYCKNSSPKQSTTGIVTPSTQTSARIAPAAARESIWFAKSIQAGFLPIAQAQYRTRPPVVEPMV